MPIGEVENILKSMRRHNRKVIVLPAELDVEGRRIDCTAYDISLGGVRLKVGAPLRENSRVIVKIKDKLHQVAKVVWYAEGFVGLNFKEGPNNVKSHLGVLATHLN